MSSAAISEQYTAAREHVALISRHRGLIVVSGRDRASYLQGLLTNDIVALGAGQGCYAAYLTPQGRLITDLFVYELGDVILLTMPTQMKDTLLARLDQFIFTEDVQLGDVTGSFAVVDIVGPQAAAALAAAAGLEAAELSELPEDGNIRREIGGQPAILVRVGDAGIAGFELIAAREQVDALRTALHAAGAVDVEPATADVLRVEAGVPLFGRDMDEETIPLEAGIESRAISFTKGCYVGQEVIIRVLHRGHGRVARRLVGLAFSAGANVPNAGTAVIVGDREIGTVTSSVLSPALGRPIALAYVKRDFVEPGTQVVTAAGSAGEVVTLPFVTSSPGP